MGYYYAKSLFSLDAIIETFLNQQTTIISMIMQGFSMCIDYNLVS